MNNLQALKQKAKELNEEIEKLEAVNDWPQKGDKYWYVSNDGTTNCVTWYDDEADKGIASMGNIFRTQEPAEKELEARNVIAELRMQHGRKMFEVEGSNNWCVRPNLCHKMIKLDLCPETPTGFGQAYFETAKDTQNAIDTVGSERILAAVKWLAMGV